MSVINKQSLMANNNNVDDKITPLVKAMQKASVDLMTVMNEEVNVSKIEQAYYNLEATISKLKAAQPKGNKKDDMRDRDWKPFMKWLRENGFNAAGEYKIEYIPGKGFGIKATKDYKKGDPIMNVPLKLMMTNKTAIDDPKLALLFHNDQLLQSVYTMSLALHLLREKFTLDSFWGPYIESLPMINEDYPINWSKEEVMALKDTYMWNDILRLKATAAKLYSHVYMRLESQKQLELIFKRSIFTYRNFIWAYGSVMSRKNNIYIKGKNDTPIEAFALIPLFDLINHEGQGEISVDYNVDKESLVCAANRDFKNGEEILIFYGPRSNSEFLNYQGFTIPNNANNWLGVQYSLNKNDKFLQKKVEVLESHKLAETVIFALKKKPLLPKEMIPFLRIMWMKTEQEIEKIEDAFKGPISDDNELFAYNSILWKVSPLLEKLPKEDLKIKIKEARTSVERNTAQILDDEKTIISSVLNHVQSKLEHLKSKKATQQNTK